MRHVHMSRFTKGIACVALAGAMTAGCFGTALASNIASDSTPANTTDLNLLTTASVRAGSAGPDFLGITNTNYDFQPSHTAKAGDPYPYTAWGADGVLGKADQFNRLAVWGTGSNTNANPYYQNLLAQYLLDKVEGQGGLPDGYQMATTYHANKETSAWGDVTYDGRDGYGHTEDGLADKYVGSNIISQDLVFGANKFTNWNGDYTAYTQTALYNKDAVYTNNDSTNLWTQIYTIEQLAIAADKAAADTGKDLRYGDAVDTAINYEKGIKGQMLYVASKLDKNDNGVVEDSEKTTKVAYLYAIMDGTGYFFVPGTDTEGSKDGNTANSTKSAADTDYVSNNSTINMGYMATLPFVTETFDSGEALEGGIVMKVEDIWKSNPTCMVSSSSASDILSDVDIIIYNSGNYTGYDATTEDGSSGSTMAGTNNGRNSSGIGNTNLLNNDVVTAWASAYGFEGRTIAGDDYGTSTRQQTSFESAPILYCARNYTVDKNTRAAWGFSMVFPELYDGNEDATYAYWLEQIYHIQSDKVANTVAQMTHQSLDSVNMYENNASVIDEYAETGYAWYQEHADESTSDAATKAYYTGATRASWYTNAKNIVEATESVEGETTEEEAATKAAELLEANYVTESNGIGIFAPSASWTAADHPEQATFPDVDDSQWYAKSIYRSVKLGLFSGYSDGTFGPNNTLTRGQLAVVLWRYLDPDDAAAYDKASAKNETGMSDVADAAYYTGAANWAVKNGVITGMDNGTKFDPIGTVTAEQLCSILYKATKAEAPEGTSKVDALADSSSISSWAKKACEWAMENGVLSGYNNADGTKSLRPQEGVSRARTATILVNAISNNVLVAE